MKNTLKICQLWVALFKVWIRIRNDLISRIRTKSFRILNTAYALCYIWKRYGVLVFFLCVLCTVYYLYWGNPKTDNPDVLYILTTVNSIAAEGTFRSFQVTRGFQAGLKGVSNIKRFLIIPTYKVPWCPLLTYRQVYSKHRCDLFLPVLRIHDILVWIRIRIRIRGSMPLTNESGCVFGSGSGSCYFHHSPSRRQQKKKILNSFSAYYF